MIPPPSGFREVIIANGSSVDAMPPEFWGMEDTLYIGTNRALAMVALQRARLDAVILRDRCPCLWAKPEVGVRYHIDLWKPATCYKVGPSDRRHTHCDEFVRQEPGWQYAENRDRNNEAAVMKNSCVAVMAANIAWHWGVRDFVLVGVDYHGAHAAMIDGYGVAKGNEHLYSTGQGATEKVERQFGEMRQAIETGGGSIINVSPNTKLKAISCENSTVASVD